MKNQITIGGLAFIGERMGTHIHVNVRFLPNGNAVVIEPDGRSDR